MKKDIEIGKLKNDKNNTELKEHIEFFNDNKLVVFPCENKRT